MAFTQAQICDILAHFGIADDPVAVVAIAGADGSNDLNTYDDRFYHCIGGHVQDYPGNVDPTRQRRGMATLARMRVFHWRPGIHGISKPAHRRYGAFVQAEAVTVNRFQQGADTGWFGINHHKGGFGNTSSLGCQTYPPAVWAQARQALYQALGTTVAQVEGGATIRKSFPYVVVPHASAKAILAQGNAPAEPQVPAIEIAPAWSIRLESAPGAAPEIYSNGINIGGRVFVPVRDFCVSALDCTPDAAPLEWRDDPNDAEREPDLLVQGTTVEEVTEINGHAYVWIREVASALGYEIVPNQAARNLVLRRKP